MPDASFPQAKSLQPGFHPPELLVSVRSLAEAKTAASQGVDILDFKEPKLGALAAVDPALWRAAAERFGTTFSGPPLRLSAALGDTLSAAEIAKQLPPEFSYAKAGPQGCSAPEQLDLLWQAVRSQLPSRVELVAVAYADARWADCLPVEDVISLAAQRGFQRVLVDTYLKQGRSSVNLLTPSGVQQIRALTQQAGLKLMLAGTIRLSELDDWLNVETCPDGFGVRTDVCQSGRTSKLDPQKIAAWQQRLARPMSTESHNRN